MRTIVVLVAHGSRVPEAAVAHEMVCSQLRHRLGDEIAVQPGYLELTAPDIPTAIDRAVASGAERVVVLPYFLHPGNHTLRDIPEAIAAAQLQHPDTSIDQAAVFGADPALLGALTEQIRVAVSEN